ncbi:hypothetical protein [Sphingorhabdus sp.]|uniref:hypothetical protein n=1 Tax=Sphingorhabdus sp. TaxID=1902408 RepID=UPI0038FC7409
MTLLSSSTSSEFSGADASAAAVSCAYTGFAANIAALTIELANSNCDFFIFYAP